MTLNGEPVPDQAGLQDSDVIVAYGVEIRFEYGASRTSGTP